MSATMVLTDDHDTFMRWAVNNGFEARLGDARPSGHIVLLRARGSDWWQAIQPGNSFTITLSTVTLGCR